MPLDSATVDHIVRKIKANPGLLTKTGDPEDPDVIHSLETLAAAIESLAPESYHRHSVLMPSEDGIGQVFAGLPAGPIGAEIAEMLCRSRGKLDDAYGKIKIHAFKYGFDLLNKGSPILFRKSTFLTAWLKAELEQTPEIKDFKGSLADYIKTTKKLKLTASELAGKILTQLSTMRLPKLIENNLRHINTAYEIYCRDCDTEPLPKKLNLIVGNYFFLQFINPFLLRDPWMMKILSADVAKDVTRLIQKLTPNAFEEKLPVACPKDYPSFKEEYGSILKEIIAALTPSEPTYSRTYSFLLESPRADSPRRTLARFLDGSLPEDGDGSTKPLLVQSGDDSDSEEVSPQLDSSTSSLAALWGYVSEHKWFVGGGTASLAFAITIGLLLADTDTRTSLLASSASGVTAVAFTWLYKQRHDSTPPETSDEDPRPESPSVGLR